MPTFDKRGIYQSDLVSAGPVWLQFKGQPMLSKNKKDHYVAVCEGDDPEDHWLTLENEAIKAWVEGLPMNEWLLIEAEGSRESAILRCTDGPAKGSESAAEPSAPRKPGPTPAQVPQFPPKPQAAEPLSRDTWHALEAAHAIVDLYVKEYGAEPSDAVLRIAAGLTIEHHRSGRPIAKDS